VITSNTINYLELEHIGGAVARAGWWRFSLNFRTRTSSKPKMQSFSYWASLSRHLQCFLHSSYVVRLVALSCYVVVRVLLFLRICLPQLTSITNLGLKLPMLLGVELQFV